MSIQPFGYVLRRSGDLRFYVGLNKAGAVVTAWSLPGAKFFLSEIAALREADRIGMGAASRHKSGRFLFVEIVVCEPAPGMDVDA